MKFFKKTPTKQTPEIDSLTDEQEYQNAVETANGVGGYGTKDIAELGKYILLKFWDSIIPVKDSKL